MELKNVIKQKDKNFYINKENKTVVCALIVDINEYEFSRIVEFRKLIEKYNFQRVCDGYYKFVGKAKCCPDDEFNEQLGKDLAYFRAKQNLLKKFHIVCRNYHRQIEKEYFKFDKQISDSFYKVHRKYAGLLSKVKPTK